MQRTWCLVGIIICLAACDKAGPEYPSNDTEPGDGKSMDTGKRADTAEPAELGRSDTGPGDLGPSESTAPDTVEPDTVLPDIVQEDTLQEDTVQEDTFFPDTQEPDIFQEDLQDDDVPGEPGQVCLGDWECPEGWVCVQPYCKLCGPEPQSYCVPKPCPGACWRDWDCQDSMKCYGADIPYAVMGLCHVPPEAPQCWTNEECPQGAACQGAAACPPCAFCDMIDVPGVCALPAGEQEVILWVWGTQHLPGEKVNPTWFNLTDTKLFLPGCTTYNLEKQQGPGQWTDLGPPAMCGWEGIAVPVEAGGAWQAMGIVPSLGEDDYATFRLRAQYWLGCMPDQPISTAGCTGGPVDVYSPVFSVGPPPP